YALSADVPGPDGAISDRGSHNHTGRFAERGGHHVPRADLLLARGAGEAEEFVAQCVDVLIVVGTRTYCDPVKRMYRGDRVIRSTCLLFAIHVQSHFIRIPRYGYMVPSRRWLLCVD